MIESTQLRIIIAVVGALLLVGMYFFGRPKKPVQGTRNPRRESGAERMEPTLGDADAALDDGLDPELAEELQRLSGEIARSRDPGEELNFGARPPVGVRGEEKVERIISLFVCAQPGETIGGPELIVAAEKAGLEFGDREIFHRLVEGKPAQGPIFSVANMVKPGSFDMTRVSELRTPGVCFFMTLPGPLPALDAWETMLPIAQRLAELLDAQVLDAAHNALGRQTIQHLRDELRAFDRKQEKNVIRRTW
jgi:cell division protein ZipA